MEKSNPLSANSTPRILPAFLTAFGARPINLAAVLGIGLLLGFGPSPASATTFTVTVGRRWLRILAFIRHDPSGRYRGVDLELQRPQQHFGFSGRTHRAVGLYHP